MKFTYKKMKHTGPYRAFQTKHTDIKLGGKLVGYMSEQRPDFKWRINFRVLCDKSKCGWRWARLRFVGDSEQACRDFLAKHGEDIQHNCTLIPED